MCCVLVCVCDKVVVVIGGFGLDVLVGEVDSDVLYVVIGGEWVVDQFYVDCLCGCCLDCVMQDVC